MGVRSSDIDSLSEPERFGFVVTQDVWIQSSLGDGWTVANQLAEQGGLPVVGEVRVFPRIADQVQVGEGFRIVTVTGDAGGLVTELAPDLRFSPRCGQCGTRAAYRDTRSARRLRHVPLWGIPVTLCYAPRRAECPWCAGVYVESMPWARGKQQMTHALLAT